MKSNGPRNVPTNIFQVVGQAFQIAESQSTKSWLEDCDVAIEPAMSEFTWDDFGRVDEMILAGEHAARQMLPALRRLLERAEERAAAGSRATGWAKAKEGAKA